MTSDPAILNPKTTPADDLTFQTLSERLAHVAASAAREAGRYVSEKFHAGVTAQEKAGYQDLVTEHDRAAERLITEHIMSSHPDSAIVGKRADGPAKAASPDTSIRSTARATSP